MVTDCTIAYNIFAIQLSKMATKVSQSPPVSPPKPQPVQKPAKKIPDAVPQPPVVVPDPATRLQRCQLLSNSIVQKLQSQISTGQLPISSSPLHIEIQKQCQTRTQNPQKSLSQKISQLHNDLTSLQNQISLQKQQQKYMEQKKRRQAKQMIERLKKQKQEYRSKIKINQMNNRLKNSVLSEDVLKLMRDRRDSLVQERKKDMEERIYKNVSRRVERQEDQNHNQVSYWQKIKQIQSRKRHHSTKILPSIHNLKHSSQQPQFGVNLSKIQRKNSHKIVHINQLALHGDKLGHKRSFSKQDLTKDTNVDYSQIVSKFLQRAKAKMESKSQRVEGRSRLNTYQVVSEKNQSGVGASRVFKNQRIQKIVGSYVQNKHKLLGNQYLKESLLRVSRAKSPTLQDSQAEQTLQLKGSPVLFQRNNKLTNYQERRNKIFSLLLSQKLDKARAIQMLNPIQSMLDRLNPEGIEERLRYKLEVFSQYQKIWEQRNQYQKQRQRQREEENSQQVI